MKFNSDITLWGVYSAWYRNFKVYQNTWLVNCLPPMLEPLINLLAFGYGLTPLVGEVIYEGQSVNYLKFIAPGMIAIGTLSQSYFEGAYGTFIRINFQKTWQGLLTAPLTFGEVLWGDILWAATRGFIAAIVTGIVEIVLGLYSGWNLLISVPIIALGCILFAAMGVLSAGLVKTIDQMNVPIFLALVPMYTLCGTYFPRETLPPWLAKISGILPLASLVDLLRWPLGLPDFWIVSLLWMLLLITVFSWIAWKKIYPQLFR